MFSTSTDFENASKANIRKPRARAEITWTDSFIDNTINASGLDENRGSITSQAANNIEVTGAKWAHLNNTIIADGSFKVMPVYPHEGEVGYWNNTVCDGSGLWAVNPELTINFSTRPVKDIVLVGDTVYNEYPVDFTISLYNEEVLVKTKSVLSNTSVSASVDLGSYYTCNKMVLEIETWSAPLQVVKITEFYSTITQVYYDDEIFNLSILEEMETKNASLPIGNISSNEISLGVDNIDYEYTYGNTDSLYRTILKKNRRIKIWIGFNLPSGSSDTTNGDYLVETVDGVKIGFIPYGVYWSGDWVSSFDGEAVNTVARDRMEILRKHIFKFSDVYENITLYDLTETVMRFASIEIADLRYRIGEELKNTTISYAWFDRISYFEVIKKIVEVGLTFAYVDRLGVVIIGAAYPTIEGGEALTFGDDTVVDTFSSETSYDTF